MLSEGSLHSSGYILFRDPQLMNYVLVKIPCSINQEFFYCTGCCSYYYVNGILTGSTLATNENANAGPSAGVVGGLVGAGILLVVLGNAAVIYFLVVSK